MKQVIMLVLSMSCLLLMVQASMAQANKQESYSINFGPELITPESDFRTTHRTGFGGSVKLEYTFGKHLSTTFNTGVNIMPGRRYIDPATLFNVKYKQLTAIPAKLGARYYFGNFYLAGEGGVVFLQNYTNSTNAVLSLGLGDKIKIGQRRLGSSARQEVWFTPARNLNMAVVRVAYEIVW
jgi:hypothetical protein